MSLKDQEPMQDLNNEPTPQETASKLCGDLKAYLDGELTPPRRWIVRWHLARCMFCQEEERWLRRLGEDMRDLEKARPRPELRRRILASLPDTPPAGMPGRTPLHSAASRESDRQRRAPYLIGAGAILAPLLLVGVFLTARSLSVPNQDVFANTPNERSGASNSPMASNSDQDLERRLTPLPTPPMPEDPLSKQADQIVANEGRITPDSANPQDQKPKPSKKETIAPVPVQKIVHLTLVAMDVGIAHDRLQALATDAGGSVTDLHLLHPHTEEKDPVTSGVKTPDGGGVATGSAPVIKPPITPKENEPFLLVAEIPVGRAVEFRRSLASYGTVTLTKVSHVTTSATHPAAQPSVSHSIVAPSVIITNNDGSPAFVAAAVPNAPVPARATVRFIIRVQTS